MDTTSIEALPSHLVRRTAIIAFGFIAAALAFAVVADRHLAADGVWYLSDILDTGWFTQYSWSRRHANYITEWPLVLAVRAGMTHMPSLSMILGLGIVMPYALSFAMCLCAVRREHRFLLLFPLASMVLVNLTASSILAGEHHVMSLATWPLLLMLLRQSPPSRLDLCLVVVVGMAYTRMYEAAIGPALIIAVVAALRFRGAACASKKLLCVATFLFCVLAVTGAGYYALFPFHAGNRTSFIAGMCLVARHPAAVASTAFLLLFVAGLLTGRRGTFRAALVPPAAYFIVSLLPAAQPYAGISFACRTLSITALPLLMVAAIVAWRRPCTLDKYGATAFIVFAVAMASGNIAESCGWLAYKRDMLGILQTRHGYIPIATTSVKDNRYRWPWNSPLLSVVWSAPAVHAIVLNEPDVTWQPFDPHVDRPLKKYLTYDALLPTNQQIQSARDGELD